MSFPRRVRLACALSISLAVASASFASPPVAGASAVARRVPVSAADPTADEAEFVDHINRLRTSLGLVPLAVDPGLTDAARSWARTMQQAGNIFHTAHLDEGITADWQKLGENVGVGGTVPALHDAFVASPKHYENLVDPSYRFIGVGVVWDGDRMFTTHRFMALQPPAPPTTAPPSTTTAPAPTTAPPTTVPAELASRTPEAPATMPVDRDRIRAVLAAVDDLLA